MENDNLLYFAGINGGGGGADAELDAGMFRARDFSCVVPVDATHTAIVFKADDDSDSSDDRKIDAVIVTHTDRTVTFGHRVRQIAEAMCHAVNAGPHVNGMVDVVDVDNEIYFSNFEDVSSDSGFDIQIFKNDKTLKSKMVAA
tara:strand:+ start:27 stop:455 length:429 start_codon:yes stop_codon:yes gene_type:complete